jgi:hypothetical protein
MSNPKTSDQEDKLFTLLANPLTRAILAILVGIDPGTITKKKIDETVNDS